ncbi:MAG: diguanylate cyclase, partial [Solirubrobacteraceae bacterium]|nr:diguanylate cyclase [Solirubrobacteraceae bacterium]
ALVPYDDLSLYEIAPGGTTLTPVFARGNWVAEIMANEISVTHGVTGWAVRNRRTRNVPNTLLEPLCTIVAGTDEEAEAFVAVPLLARDRVVGSLNVYRTGAEVPFSAEEVELVERFATMAALAYDSARQRELLREEVKTDGLTGLLNHRGCQERLRAAIAEAALEQEPVTVVVLDLDHFKRINDTHGHAEGDRALAEAAGRLRSVVRDGDAVGRLGGEEFVLVLPGVAGSAAREAAERARNAVAEVHVGGRSLACSAGIAAYPDDAGDAAELLACADAALYAAKDTGRDRACRYRSSLARRPSPGEEREEIEALLERAEVLITPVFQPILELATGRVAGYEALARMRTDPPRPPDEWFAQAHRTGLGGELEAAALRAAIEAPGRPAGAFLAVNVSPRALMTDVLAQALPDDLSSIVVELTEHQLFSVEGALERRLAELRARGARVALDDAGSGYAGLQQLIRVAPDILKLDRSLVDGVHADPAKLALLEAMISFATSTGAAVCGEGIEDLSDLRALAALDAAYGQGYAIARPAPGWPALEPGVGAAASAQVEMGVRIPDGSSGALAWSRGLAELADRLALVRDKAGLAAAARHAARLLGADDVALMRVHEDGNSVSLVSEHASEAVAADWRLSDFPATAHLIATGQAGQVVAGDAQGDPAELAELERMEMGAMLIVPTPLGAVEPALVEVYRTRPQAFSRAEVERARVVVMQIGAVLGRLGPL